MVRKAHGEEELITESNQVLTVGFEHPKYETHKCEIPTNAHMPLKEVEEYEINHVDRRYF